MLQARNSYHRLHVPGAMFPLAAGLLMFGWRAAGAVAVVLGFAWLGGMVWRRIGWRGGQLQMPEMLWHALLLAMMLPAHLLSDTWKNSSTGAMPWCVLAGAGLLLAMVSWLVGGRNLHPVLVTYLLLAALLGHWLRPHSVLYPDHMLVGDVVRFSTVDAAPGGSDPWFSLRSAAGADARFVRYSAAWLLDWNPEPGRGYRRAQVSLDSLPPLEDLAIGAHAAPLGTASALAVVIGGLYLLYRGLIDYRLPLLIALSAGIGLLVLPLPYTVPEVAARWRGLLWPGVPMNLAAAFTFVNYQMLASPALFVAFFLATAGSVRPVVPSARVVFAVVCGLLVAASQLYLSVAHGPYLALLIAALLAPLLNRRAAVRPIV